MLAGAGLVIAWGLLGAGLLACLLAEAGFGLAGVLLRLAWNWLVLLGLLGLTWLAGLLGLADWLACWLAGACLVGACCC